MENSVKKEGCQGTGTRDCVDNGIQCKMDQVFLPLASDIDAASAYSGAHFHIILRIPQVSEVRSTTESSFGTEPYPDPGGGGWQKLWLGCYRAEILVQRSHVLTLLPPKNKVLPCEVEERRRRWPAKLPHKPW